MKVVNVEQVCIPIFIATIDQRLGTTQPHWSIAHLGKNTYGKEDQKSVRWCQSKKILNEKISELDMKRKSLFPKRLRDHIFQNGLFY